MPTYVPDPGETLSDLVLRVLPGLPPGVRAGAQVVTGGERAGLVVPGHAAPVADPLPGPEPEKPKPAAPRRTRRRTSKEK